MHCIIAANLCVRAWLITWLGGVDNRCDCDIMICQQVYTGKNKILWKNEQHQFKNTRPRQKYWREYSEVFPYVIPQPKYGDWLYSAYLALRTSTSDMEVWVTFRKKCRLGSTQAISKVGKGKALSNIFAGATDMSAINAEVLLTELLFIHTVVCYWVLLTIATNFSTECFQTLKQQKVCMWPYWNILLNTDSGKR